MKENRQSIRRIKATKIFSNRTTFTHTSLLVSPQHRQGLLDPNSLSLSLSVFLIRSGRKPLLIPRPGRMNTRVKVNHVRHDRVTLVPGLPAASPRRSEESQKNKQAKQGKGTQAVLLSASSTEATKEKGREGKGRANRRDTTHFSCSSYLVVGVLGRVRRLVVRIRIRIHWRRCRLVHGLFHLSPNLLRRSTTVTLLRHGHVLHLVLAFRPSPRHRLTLHRQRQSTPPLLR
mmetsp:Transcript_4141/g.12049  ORF Transcript_4141/g.12049 Transcript_4141/m.12049 type:complete len:231 (+) Transcript_4141:4620-5312(+)